MGSREECEVSNSSLVFCPLPVVLLYAVEKEAFFTERHYLLYGLYFSQSKLYSDFKKKGEEKSNVFQKKSSIVNVELAGMPMDLDQVIAGKGLWCWMALTVMLAQDETYYWVNL